MEEVFEKRSNLVMPTHYVELDSEEMSYVEAGWGIFGTIVGGVTSAVKSTFRLICGQVWTPYSNDDAFNDGSGFIVGYILWKK